MPRLLALYQEYPQRAVVKHSRKMQIPDAEILQLFPATEDGLERLLKAASQSNAKIVILHKKYFQGEVQDLLQFVKSEIKQKHFKSVWRRTSSSQIPVQKLNDETNNEEKEEQV